MFFLVHVWLISGHFELFQRDSAICLDFLLLLMPLLLLMLPLLVMLKGMIFAIFIFCFIPIK